jgi:flagellar protein FlgJ
MPVAQQPEVAAQQFEALLVQQMLESMWSTVPQNGLLSGSNEEAMYRDMLNEALASSISEGKGLGVKDVILKDFNKLNKKA